jgi:hypothetical protein
MEHAKKDEDPSAAVCPELGNHEVRHLKLLSVCAQLTYARCSLLADL